ncbi:piggyBac transposable element-derived protein 4-like [Homalodisca vitripennis]|uniref:piggyBac transposable element-derived protein 4-like n=1 Tax=Homalodisca vitripennis TaxID=197043 RepID=UPI001EEB2195|nr:piggyBac transposable element-derived protein 4-like [Homalodisca vitripennis]
MAELPGTSRDVSMGDSDLDSGASDESGDSDLDAAQAHQTPLPDDIEDLYSDGEEDENRLEKVNLLISSFNSVMSNVYQPGKELSIDESIMLWRGRLYFRQYIKNKRHKYGLKIYSLCEPDGLCLKFTIYSGKGGELIGVGHGNKVVMYLMRHRLGVGHSLYMDNYYNSVPLAAELLRESTYCTGTLRADRKYLPREVTTAVLRTGETVARYAEGIAVGKWKDKRTVMYISTEFQNTMAVSNNRRGVPRQKPLAIVHYNAEMSGVDRHDQMMAYYPCEHKSLRWYKKVFVHILQRGMINAFRLYRKANPTSKKSLYDFRLNVIRALLPPKENLQLRPVQRNASRHVLSKITKQTNKTRVTRKRCRQCAKEGNETRTIYFCAQCEGEPGLCALACFDKWHA